MNFRKDINGLRAIAVIAVVLFHFNSTLMPGGFAGVDVFFVISGFLMTGIIFRGIERDKFSILSFYIARANRIVPALAMLCTVLIIFGWFYLIPMDYRVLGKHATSSMLFLSNVLYSNETDYFDTLSQGKWLLHTWSLSVEWQFYIIYPVILVMMKKVMSLRTMKLSIVTCTVLGFVFSIYASYRWPSEAYYLLLTRAWEMMVGGVAYLFPLNLNKKNKVKLEYLGLGLIVFTYAFISENNMWPGYLALIPVLGTYFVIQSQRNSSIISGNLIFQKIGSWSYSIYLWHWPIVVLIYYSSASGVWIYIGIMLSIVLGALSYRYIETIKFRNVFSSVTDFLKFKPLFIILFVSATGSIIYLSEGVNKEFRNIANSPKAKFIESYKTLHKNLDEAYWLKCDAYNSLDKFDVLDIDKSCTAYSEEGGVFLWGDSHAEALSFGIRNGIKGASFYQVTSASCKVSLHKTFDQSGKIKTACDHSNNFALEKIKKIKPDLVIIAQANSHEKTDWDKISEELKSLGVGSVILIGPVPQWRPSLPRVITKDNHWGREDMYINDEGLDQSVFRTDAILIKRKFPENMSYFSLVEKMCSNKNAIKFCKARLDDGSLMQVDYGHLSPKGSLYIFDHVINPHLDFSQKVALNN